MSETGETVTVDTTAHGDSEQHTLVIDMGGNVPPPLPEAFTRRRDKVAIVGFANHKDQAPFEDDSFEIWGLNELYDHIPIQSALEQKRVRWFEIHTREGTHESNPFQHSRNTTNEHAAKLSALGPDVPVFMQRHWDDIPNSVQYPKDEMVHRYGDYVTNSVSWMIALAVYMGFKEIGIYGVDMAQDSEYEYQRPSCEYYIGLARGAGIQIYIPPDSDLCKAPYLYGWETEEAHHLKVKLKARLKELEGRLNQVSQQQGQINDARNQLIGAIEDCKYNYKLVV